MTFAPILAIPAIPLIAAGGAVVGPATWTAWSNPYVQALVAGDVAFAYEYEYGEAAGGAAAAESKPVSPTNFEANKEPPVSSNRGTGTALEDVSKRDPQAQAYEDGATGAASDIASKKRIAPPLKYDNPNPSGKSFVKFDGYDVENKQLIDRKWNVTTYPKSLNQLRRMSEALNQNRGYSGVVEVPNMKAYKNAINAVNKSGVSNISVRITQ